MRHGSLFSGIGGFDLAAEWMEWENVFHCEWNEFGQRVLKYYWPNAISYGDITKTDFTVHRGDIDILTGGFPCQPYSMAGKRKGTEDDRHLWPQMLRAVREIKPTWVVGENVFGITNWDGGVVFNQVQADLEAEGYEVQPYVLPACSVNAPHRRDRVWFVAHSDNGSRSEYGLSTRWKMSERTNNGVSPNTEGSSGTRQLKQGQGKRELGGCDCDVIAYPLCRRQPCQEHGEEKSERITENGIPNNWQDFPTVSPLCDRNDGLSDRLAGITFSKWRNESIKAMGNAIVPQIALMIFRAIAEYENI